jgi:HK97 gp10 family phage protein
MTATINVTLDDHDSLAKRFNRLATDVKKTIAKDALYPAAVVFAAQMKANAAVVSGAMRRAINVVDGNTSRGEVASVNAEINRRSFPDSAFYPAYQELGWKAGARRKTVRRGAMVLRNGRMVRQKVLNTIYGKPRKQVPGTHFIKRAFDQRKQQASELALSRLAASIEREAAR